MEQPKDWNLPALTELFELLGIAPGNAKLITQGDSAPIGELQAKISQLVEKLVMAQQALQGKLFLWSQNLLDDSDNQKYQNKLSKTKDFLESLQSYNTAGKLKNFRYDRSEVKSHKPGLVVLQEIDALQELITELSPIATYLSTAEGALLEDSNWVDRVKALRNDFLRDIKDVKKRASANFKQQSAQLLGKLKKDYINHYMELVCSPKTGPVLVRV